MSGLQQYLDRKRAAILARRERIDLDAQPRRFSANVSAEGSSGLRRIRIREFQVISDSGPDFAGYNLGPSSPELQLGVLGSCITHVFLIQAADRQVPLDAVEVEVSAEFDPRAGKPGFEDVPVYPQRLRYEVQISSSASDRDLRDLHAAVERACPILNLLLNPQEIRGEIVRVESEALAAVAD